MYFIGPENAKQDRTLISKRLDPPSPIPGRQIGHKSLLRTTTTNAHMRTLHLLCVLAASYVLGVEPLSVLHGLAARTTITATVLAISALSPFVDDAEGLVASKIPKTISNAVRDTKEAWETFNALTWALTVPALAVTKLEVVREFLDDEQLTQTFDVSYGTEPLQKLDLFHHNEQSLRPHPVCVFVHGGAWSHGSKELFRMVGKRLRNEGYIGGKCSGHSISNTCRIKQNQAESYPIFTPVTSQW